MAFAHGWFTKSRKPARGGGRNRRCASAEEPSSPRVGCMGQIKRCKPPANVSGLRLFTASASTSSSSSSSSSSTGRSPTRSSGGGGSVKSGRGKALTTALVMEMDPPLPVVRRERASPAESLWRRRRRGVDLGDLQLRRSPEVRVEGILE
ncbi:hypothetical protein HPP92_002180 [Vanilla planifolia]|uniref:Uncharacterized protein n=1 Tax=Vanilla planifolia TaxID=51239 RepID=A0A835RXP3_VANPL|nr:hypothetical protein HPP92_002180 [Vanilla planifolia]